MMSDYYTELLLRRVTRTPDDGGSYTIAYEDVPFQGRIGELSSNEVLRHQQLGDDATFQLDTEEVISETDRIVYRDRELEVATPMLDFSRRYLLRQAKS